VSNREKRFHSDFVHVYLAFKRVSKGGDGSCMRSIDKGLGDELEVLEAKLRVLGGNWRIHKTVNPRCVKKALRVLLHDLIDHPEHASHVDSTWRTALMQRKSIYGDKKFMLDVDTENISCLEALSVELKEANAEVLDKIKSPNGWHYITKPFDTRKVCELSFVTLLRDGYYYIKSVNES